MEACTAIQHRLYYLGETPSRLGKAWRRPESSDGVFSVCLPFLNTHCTTGCGMLARPALLLRYGVDMLARIRAAWPAIVNVGSMLWAIGHCWITAFGSQADRLIAAASGIIGAAIILAVLNVSIWRRGHDDGYLSATRDAAQRFRPTPGDRPAGATPQRPPDDAQVAPAQQRR